MEVEAQEMSPFYVRDASFGYEPADVADSDAEALRDLVDRQ
jgi:hypothetical protein